MPLVGFALLLLWPELAIGAEEGETHGASWTILILHVANFSFLAFLLYRYARRPILDYLAQRSLNIKSQLESAQERLRSAETELAELRERLAHLHEEEERLLSLGAERGEGERARSIARGEETARRIREDAQRVAAQEIARARQVLREEAADLAAELAAELLRQNLTVEDDRRLVQEFIERVGEGETATTPSGRRP